MTPAKKQKLLAGLVLLALLAVVITVLGQLGEETKAAGRTRFVSLACGCDNRSRAIGREPH
jgi:hypothetical protein